MTSIMNNELLTKTQLEAWNNSFEISTLKKHMNRDTDYHNRLEQEVTSLKRDNIILETEVTNLRHELSFAHTEIRSLRIENNKSIEKIEQLRQAIAVLNDEPTNSL